MSLAARLQTVDTEPQKLCRTCAWLREQSDEDQRAFAEWIDSGKPRTHLLDACRAEGLDVSESSLRRHIRNCMDLDDGPC